MTQGRFSAIDPLTSADSSLDFNDSGRFNAIDPLNTQLSLKVAISTCTVGPLDNPDTLGTISSSAG